MKKTITILLFVLILLNFIKPIVIATDSSTMEFGKDESLQEITGGQTESNFNGYINDGSVTTHGDETDGPATTKPSGGSFLDGPTKLISKLLTIFPSLGNGILSLITYGKLGETFTIQKLLCNEYGITDINFFKDTEEGVMYQDTIDTIKQSISIWYVSIRNISIVALAIVLIYVAIRTAVSTVADERAKYKKMFMFWFEAMALLFILHYIVVLAINVSEAISGLLIKAMDNISTSAGTKVSVEENLILDAKNNIDSAQGAQESILYLVLFTMLVYYELKFFIMYLTRILRVGFYMVIAPFVCVTYPIDKIGDGKAQAFRNWLTEMLMEIFLQPMHLAIYIVFLFSAGEIIELSPFIGVVFLAALGNAEKIIRKLLKIKPKFAKGISETKLPGQT